MCNLKIRSLLAIIAFPVFCFGQYKDSTSEFKFSGYLDAYYARYSDSVGIDKFQKFPAIGPKSNEFGLDVIQVTAQYNSTKVRGIATIHYGDLPIAAWSAALNLVQEANVGIRLNKKFWLDAGLFKTHIGTEALLPKDNLMSTISIITFYEPWFQSGVKLSYQPTNDKWLFCLHILNGYNTFVETNSKKSMGLAVSYSMGDKGSIGYYNLIGDEFPDSCTNSHVRFLNNFVLNYQFTKKLKALVGLDYIGQQNSDLKDNTKMASIYSAIVTLKYQAYTKFACYGRYEMFSDEQGVLTGTIADANYKITGYKLNGVTLGVEFKPTDNSFIRLEGRDLMMDRAQNIFRTDNKNTNNRLEAVMNLGVWF